MSSHCNNDDLIAIMMHKNQITWIMFGDFHHNTADEVLQSASA